MANGSGGRGRARQSRRDRWRVTGEDARDVLRHGIDLGEYLDELAEIRAESRENLAVAGERSLKTLDRFLANLARALGMAEDRASMGDSLRFLERIAGTPREIAVLADRYRDTRNAVAHNPDITLRPEAAPRIIDGVESIIRMAAETSHELAHRNVVTVGMDELVVDARDRMLAHGYNQLVVVDEHGGLVDLLTERDIVVVEARSDIDENGATTTVGETVAGRGRLAVAVLPKGSLVEEAISALRDERIGAVVVTEDGRLGQAPLGIITRGDVLKLV